jgi:hypothetical protein
MAFIAQDYLNVPELSISAEHKFNLGRDIMAVRRQSLENNTFRMLILLLDHTYASIDKEIITH